jgi:hypothetical protein
MKQQKQRKELLAISTIVGAVITIGVTGALGAGLITIYQSQTDPFLTSSSVEIRNLNAIRDDDTLRVTATLKNTGQTSISGILLDKITVSDIEVTQDLEGKIVLGDDTYTKEFGFNGTSNAIAREDARGISVYNDGALTESILEGGRSQAFVLEITSDSQPEISSTVQISDRLTLTLQARSGDDVIITDTFSTRVKPG